LIVTCVVVALNLFGDALREAADPVANPLLRQARLRQARLRRAESSQMQSKQSQPEPMQPKQVRP
jgi:peptide/nickel transport system permease protein